MACGGHRSWQNNFSKLWENELQRMQGLPINIIQSFALPQLHLGGGWQQKGKAFLTVENLKWMREEGKKLCQ